jgi:hypothetical protein
MRPARSAVNTHFGKVNETRQALGYLDALTIDDVLKSVLMATLKSSANLTLRDAYSQILDDLDDDKELTFAHMQQVCARQFRCRQGRRPDIPRIDRTERATQRTSPAKPESKYKRQGAHEPAVFFGDLLDAHGVKPEKVLRKAGLAGADWDEPASVKALFAAAQNTSPARSLVTVTLMLMPMPMLVTMPLPLAMTLMIVTEFLSPLWEAYRFCFSLSLCFLRLPTWRARPSQPIFANRS